MFRALLVLLLNVFPREFIMKLGSLKYRRDGQLVVVSKDLSRAVKVPEIAPTLQSALDDWEQTEPQLQAVYRQLNSGETAGFGLDLEQLDAPLPRAFQWADGSAYLNHSELMRKARNAELPPAFLTDPLMYQGCSDQFVAGHAAIQVSSDKWGIDFEAEIAAITGDVAMGSSPDKAAAEIKLLMLINDVSLRNLIPAELAKGFGFFQGKPACSASPVAVTPDELGEAWRGSKVHLPIEVRYNDTLFGNPNAGVDMNFNFGELVAHIAKTRDVGAGTIVGSGTVSNKQDGASAVEEGGVGYSCIAEVRMIEMIEFGRPSTPFMRFGDRIQIDMKSAEGDSIFGQIDQKVSRYQPTAD